MRRRRTTKSAGPDSDGKGRVGGLDAVKGRRPKSRILSLRGPGTLCEQLERGKRHLSLPSQSRGRSFRVFRFCDTGLPLQLGVRFCTLRCRRIVLTRHAFAVSRMFVFEFLRAQHLRQQADAQTWLWAPFVEFYVQQVCAADDAGSC